MTTYTKKFNEKLNREPVPVFRWTVWHTIVAFFAGVIIGAMAMMTANLAAKRAKNPVSVEYRCGEY